LRKLTIALTQRVFSVSSKNILNLVGSERALHTLVTFSIVTFSISGWSIIIFSFK